jgi:hypothetical protein
MRTGVVKIGGDSGGRKDDEWRDKKAAARSSVSGADLNGPSSCAWDGAGGSVQLGSDASCASAGGFPVFFSFR